MIRSASIFFVVLMSTLNVAWSQSTENTSDSNSAIEELESLELYSDIVVIQKKFFEKTSRWEMGVSGVTSLNNKFFSSIGAKASLGYHFNERWALEAQGWYLAQIDKSLTNDLSDKYQISTSDIVTPQAYVGLNLVWSPIYGKISLQERSVNPFELFFTFGGGFIFTDDNQTAPALNVSFGQIHPMTKNSTLRWEIGGNIFQAKGKAGAQEGQNVTSEIIYVSVGASFFFPEITR